MNAFKHGLAAIQKRREESITSEHEESIRQQILDGLIADKGGEVSTATKNFGGSYRLRCRVGSWSSTAPSTVIYT